MGDLGDLTNFMKDGSLADLSWLDVDETEYREQGPLPKQNLDVVPDLQALWAHEDKPATSYLEPNTAAKPRTMGDLSEVHGPLRARPEDIVHTARMIVMMSPDPGRIASALRGAYDTDSLRAAKTALGSVMAERGLLGRYYIDALDFPNCAKGGTKDAAFVKRYASQARFVKAKKACEDCTQCQHHGGQDMCATFDKQIQVQVPYTPELAEKVEQSQKAKGKAIQASIREVSPRHRIQRAFLAPDVSTERLAQIKPQESVARLMQPAKKPAPVYLPPDLTKLRKAATEAVNDAFRAGKIPIPMAQRLFRNIHSFQVPGAIRDIITKVGGVVPEPTPVYKGAGEQLPPVTDPEAKTKLAEAQKERGAQAAQTKAAMSARKAAPVVSLLRREMLKGRGEFELLQALKLAYTPDDLKQTFSHWGPLFQKVGKYGVLYSTQDSFDDCREGSDFLARYNPGVRAMVAGKKCSGCIYNKISRCLMYGKPLIKSVEDLLTPTIADAVVAEHKAAGRIAYTYQHPEGKDAFRAVHAAVEQCRTESVRASERQNVQTAFRGIQPQHITSSLTRREIMTATLRYMNEGLYGRDLGLALRSRFDPRDIKAAQKELRPILAEQGLQGIFYVDPSVYPDYGRGCDEAARLHRARLVKYAKVGPKCSSCVHQTKPGWCSKLAKALAVEPPYENKEAQRQAVLASGEATEVRYAELVNNGHTAMLEYEMGQHSMEVEVDEPRVENPMDIEFDGQGVKL